MATVILDAGHGGYDNGASFNGRREKDDTLNLVLAIGNILENAGIDVLYTRTSDVYQSPIEKARIANDSGADYFISIHRNSSENPETYSGVETLVYNDAGMPAMFARNINGELEKLGFRNIGVDERKDLAVLRRTRMPAALVEVGFINTAQDNSIFDLRFPEVAKAIADGIINTVYSADVAGSEAEDYSVETGMFRHYENAQMLAEQMQKDGYDCYIKNNKDFYSVLHGHYDNYDDASNEQKKLFQDMYETRIIKN